MSMDRPTDSPTDRPTDRRRLEAGPVALYAQLASILRENIKSGAWPYGFEIPTLEHLAEHYALARVTVRQAIQMLVAEKLLSSQRGRRTFVTYRPSNTDPQPLFRTVDFLDPVTPDFAIEIVSREEVTADHLGAVFFGTPRGRYVRIRKIDYESGSPYSTSVHFIGTELFERFPKESESRIKIARLIRDHSRGALKQCRERVSVVAVDHDEARWLQCLHGAPAGRIHRVFADADENVLYYGILLYRHDRFGIERDVTSMVLS